jgi:hypothetical protein
VAAKKVRLTTDAEYRGAVWKATNQIASSSTANDGDTSIPAGFSADFILSRLELNKDEGE